MWPGRLRSLGWVSGSINAAKVEYARGLLFRGDEVGQMMKVVGEEGTSLEDYVVYLKSDFLDAVYLQQNSFDPVDGSVSLERQRYVFDLLFRILAASLRFESKEEARSWFARLRQRFLDYNGAEWKSDTFLSIEGEIAGQLEERKTGIDEAAAELAASTNGSGGGLR